LQTATGERVEQREIQTFTEDFKALRRWLLENEYPVVAIESTGVYWRPVFNIMERTVQEVPVNARHTKHVPGRKTAHPTSAYVAAWAILAEIGPNLEAFRSVEPFSAWCRLSRGNHESAGKRTSARSPVRRSTIRTILVEVAWAAIKTKGSYYKAKYFSLKARIGAKKGIVGIAHRIANGLFHIIKDGAEYKELCGDYLSLLHAQQKYEYLSALFPKYGSTFDGYGVATRTEPFRKIPPNPPFAKGNIRSALSSPPFEKGRPGGIGVKLRSRS
jgi:transposase